MGFTQQCVADSPVQLRPLVSESPVGKFQRSSLQATPLRSSGFVAAPSPNTTNQQLSSAASSAQRTLHFGAPGSFLPAKQAGAILPVFTAAENTSAVQVGEITTSADRPTQSDMQVHSLMVPKPTALNRFPAYRSGNSTVASSKQTGSLAC